MQLQIEPILAFSDNYIWVLIDNTTRTVVCVDPGEAAPVRAYCQQHQLELSAILITHHHWDHTGGIKALNPQQKIPVYGPADEAINELTVRLNEGDSITLPHSGVQFSVLSTPGHTSGHIAYFGAGVLFCGDTLFCAGCGRLFEGTAEQMLASLQKLSALPGDTLVYCAHEYTAKNLQFAAQVEPANAAIQTRQQHVTQQRAQQLPSVPAKLSEELATNPFLRCTEPSVIESAQQYAGHSLTNECEVFATIRQWKDGF